MTRVLVDSSVWIDHLRGAGKGVPLLHADRGFAPFATHCGLRVV